MALTTPHLSLVASSTSEPTSTPEVTGTTPAERAEEVCRDGTASICSVVSDLTGSEEAGQWAEVFLGTPLRILLVVVVGFVVRFLAHKAIDRIANEVAEGRSGVGARSVKTRSRAAVLLESSPLHAERRVQRARTLQSVLRSLTTGVVFAVVFLVVLGELGVDLGPLIAGAGIAGVALGFGAQTLVKDFLSGIFLIVEDQFGVGDVVDLGEASGSVEAVALRVTRLRDVNGTVWYVRNGEIIRVGNQSQGWARAVIDVGVAYDEDIGQVQDVLYDVGCQLHADPDWAPLILEDPEVWGVEALAADSVVVRLVVKTAPLEQWKVARELRRRIKARFDAEGIEIPFAQRVVWQRQMEADEPTRSPKPPTEPRQKVPPGEGEAAKDVDVEERSGT